MRLLLRAGGRRFERRLVAGCGDVSAKQVTASLSKVVHFKEVGFKFGRWLDVGYWQRTLEPMTAGVLKP